MYHLKYTGKGGNTFSHFTKKTEILRIVINYQDTVKQLSLFKQLFFCIY